MARVGRVVENMMDASAGLDHQNDGNKAGVGWKHGLWHSHEKNDIRNADDKRRDN